MREKEDDEINVARIVKGILINGISGTITIK